jgi:nucleotide-binding universal stress UspA family protein
MFQKILVAIDDESTMAQQVMAEALGIAKVSGAAMNILHVMFPLKSGYPDPIYMSLDGAFTTVDTEAFGAYVQQWQDLERNNREMLESHLATAQAAGVEAQVTQRIGEPNRIICQVAKDWQADLIVIGRRGLHGFGELLLGSVSNYVLHHAPCTVLAVQGPPSATAMDTPDATVSAA